MADSEKALHCFIPGLFTSKSLDIKKIVKEITFSSAPRILMEVKEDDIVIFPSKIKHSTIPNKTENPRISISGDISIMLKDSFGHERLMPHYNNWQQF